MSATSRRTDTPMDTRRLIAIGGARWVGIVPTVFWLISLGTVGCEPEQDSRWSESPAVRRSVPYPQLGKGPVEDRAEEPIVVDTMTLNVLKRMRDVWDGVEVAVGSTDTGEAAPEVAKGQGQSRQVASEEK